MATHNNKGHKFWTPEDLELVSELYANTPTKELAALLDRSERSIYQQARLLNVYKDKEYLKSQYEIWHDRLMASGLHHRFKKGQQPPNKGKKQIEYMSAEAIEKTKDTRFKKGNIPHNAKEQDGEIVWRADKNGLHYYYIRIALGKWELLHREIYKKHFGEIPKGMIVIFKDGNPKNIAPNNLLAITRAEHLQINRNKFFSLNPEVKTSITLINKITKKTKELCKTTTTP